jgi:hypothetical protein
MKRCVALAFVLALGLAALVTAERHQAIARVGPDALLYFVADTQHELTRLPVTYTHISDKDEMRSVITSPSNADFSLASMRSTPTAEICKHMFPAWAPKSHRMHTVNCHTTSITFRAGDSSMRLLCPVAMSTSVGA